MWPQSRRALPLGWRHHPHAPPRREAWQQGHLDLDATVATILPEFAQLQVLDGFDGDQPRLRAPAGHATVRQLKTHTAGLGCFFTSDTLLRDLVQTGAGSPESGEKRRLSVPMVNDPGRAWNSGVNTDWPQNSDLLRLARGRFEAAPPCRLPRRARWRGADTVCLCAGPTGSFGASKSGQQARTNRVAINSRPSGTQFSTGGQHPHVQSCREPQNVLI